jgi:uncharacterized protein (TIGR00159 family)
MAFLHALIPFVEILIIAVLLNYLLSFFWNTRSMDLVFGVCAFLLILGASSWFHLPVLQKIMVLLGNVAMVGVIVLFQPELRVALSKLSLKSRKFREMNEIDKFLDHLSSSIYRMSEKKIGALIAIQNDDSLQEYAQKAVLLSAQFSTELLETIFSPNTPLHDGAVIITDRTIIAAGVILPLAEDTSQVAKSMGTRHRAGLGLSQTTDALVIVVSEETGKVSIAREGIMTRGIKLDRFKGVVRSVLNPSDKAKSEERFSLKEWMAR